MGRANARTQYFEKIIKPAPNVTDYIKALQDSPYKTHRRMAVLLAPELEALRKEVICESPHGSP